MFYLQFYWNIFCICIEQDDVWRDFGENCEEICFNMQTASQKPEVEKEISILESISKPSPPQSSVFEAARCNKSEARVEEDDEFDVDEYIRKYREKIEIKKRNETSNTSPECVMALNLEKSKIAATAAAATVEVAVAAFDQDQLPSMDTPVNNRLLTSVREKEKQMTITPMPNYQGMDTPNLKNELKKYGIKALPKRQAILKLVEIYQYTHRHKLASLPRSHSVGNLKQNSITNATKKGK